jgi:hypothetical protein
VWQIGQSGIQTIYQQHARYMSCRGFLETSWVLFQADIISSITRWIKKDDRIILFIDMIKHTLTGNLPQELFCLGLQEATHKHWGDLEPHTFIYGDGKPIDRVYHTPDLTIMALTQLSLHKGVGNHRLSWLTYLLVLQLGNFAKRVVPHKGRHLVTRNDNSVKAYLQFVTRES